MARSSADLKPERALIWRVVHRDNLPWILDHGLHCANSDVQCPNYVQIGLPDLIEERRSREVPIPPGGVLADYVPFYFTPFSPMVYRIVTGREVGKRPRQELCFLVTSLRHVTALPARFVFSDRHASLAAANFYSALDDLSKLSWSGWQARKFNRDLDNPEAFERYQAEALIYRHLPLAGLQGIVCQDSRTRDSIAALAAQRASHLQVVLRPEWYL